MGLGGDELVSSVQQAIIAYLPPDTMGFDVVLASLLIRFEVLYLYI